jgi:hypothetical protein
LWAHKSQSSARNPQHNLYFEDETIYSYGSHFPIARHITNASGKKHAILLTTRTNSVTTAGHISAVRGAIPSDVQVFHVASSLYDWRSVGTRAEDMADYIARINELIVTCSRARSSWRKESAHGEAVTLTAEAKAYATFFGMPAPTLPTVPALDSKEMQAVKDRETKKSAERAERTRLETIQRQKDEAERAEKWRNGEYVGSLYNTPVMLRIGQDGDMKTVETSRGAIIPVSHALRGLRFVRAVVAKQQEYVRNGHTLHLGHYAIDRIDADGTLTAGCHVIAYSEIERIAPQVEALAIEPSETE